jgi:hypothetical protein
MNTAHGVAFSLEDEDGAVGCDINRASAPNRSLFRASAIAVVMASACAGEGADYTCRKIDPANAMTSDIGNEETTPIRVDRDTIGLDESGSQGRPEISRVDHRAVPRGRRYHARMAVNLPDSSIEPVGEEEIAARV